MTKFDKENKPIATVIVWSNESNAAIINKQGRVCMQNALAIKTTNSTANVKLSEALLKLSKIASKELKDNSKSNKESLLAVTASIDQAATLLTTTTERTSFLNTGMFYLCQISANDNIENKDIEKLLAKLITSASGLKKK